MPIVGDEHRLVTMSPLFRPYVAPPGFGVLTSFFNPDRYQSKVRNYRVFRESLRVSGIPCLTVECVFPGRVSELAGWSDVHTVLASDAMWHKERLLNIAVAMAPVHWKSVAWLDCDVLFDNPRWAVEAVEQLSRQVVVQLFSDVVRLRNGETWGVESGKGGHRQLGQQGPAVTRPSEVHGHRDGPGEHGSPMASGGTVALAGDERWESFAAVLAKAPNQLLKGDFARHGHTGFAWAAHRGLLDTVGLYDACVAGNGDHMMAHAFAGDWCGACVSRELGGLTPHRRHFSKWAAAAYSIVRARVSCVPGTLFHLWHGDMANRRYAERARELASFDFDPTTDLRMAGDGCWEWASDKADLRAWAAEYFTRRFEDGALEGATASPPHARALVAP